MLAASLLAPIAWFAGTTATANASAAPHVDDCLNRPADQVTALGDVVRREKFRVGKPPANHTYDFRGTHFVASGDRNSPDFEPRPVNIGGDLPAPGLCVIGGFIQGTQSRELDWEYMKHDPGKGDLPSVRIGGEGVQLVDGVRVDNLMGAFRPVHDGMHVRNAYLHEIRDDCVENDDLRAMVVEDSLFDGCYTAFSARPAKNSPLWEKGRDDSLLVVDRVLVRLKPMPGGHKQPPSAMTYDHLWKWSGISGPAVMRDSIVMVEENGTKNHVGWPSNVRAENVTIVWGGSGEYPGDVPPGATLTRDRSVWEDAKAQWLYRHGCTDVTDCDPDRIIRPLPADASPSDPKGDQPAEQPSDEPTTDTGTVVDAVVDGDVVRLRWEPVEGADVYRVKREAPGDTTFHKIATRNPGEELTFVDTDVATPGTYRYRVATDGTSWTLSDPVAVTIEGEPSPEPTQEPSPEPTQEPSPEPTQEPSPEPSPEPTQEPSPEPTTDPVPLPDPVPVPPAPKPSPEEQPTVAPDEPAPAPTVEPAPAPTVEPAPAPTVEPAPEPTVEPAPAPAPDGDREDDEHDSDEDRAKGKGKDKPRRGGVASRAGLDGDATTSSRLPGRGPADVGVEVSRTRFEDGQADVVVLSRDDTFADALAGAVLTADAPLLLTDSDQLTPAVRSELRRVLAPGGRVLLLGGEAALSTRLAMELRAMGHEVTRLSGPTRVETSLAIADEVLRRSGGRTVAVARAFGPGSAAWADAVTGGAWTAAAGVPLVVVPATPDPAVTAWFARRGITRTIVLGGPAAVPHAVAVTLPNPTRVSGADRAGTAVAIARELWSNGGAPQRLLVVNAWEDTGWADGLTAAGLAADLDAPMLVVRDDRVPLATADAVAACHGAAAELLAVGADDRVGPSVVAQLQRLGERACA